MRKKFQESPEYFNFRDMSAFKIEVFLQDMENDLSEGKFNFNDNVNDQFGKFLAIFCKCVNNSSPIKASTKRKKLREKLWISLGLLKSIKKKNKLFTNLHKNRNEESFIYYKLYRNTLHRAIKTSKQIHYNEKIGANANSPEMLRKIVSELIRQKPKTVPAKLEFDKGIVEDPTAICNTTNNFFTEIGEKLAKSINPVVTESQTTASPTNIKNSFFLSPSTPDEVDSIIRDMKLKKAVWENDIDYQFLKYSTRVISPYLSNFFNWCVEQGEFRNVLKIAEIVPIYKKGNPDLCTNYRPISLLSPFSKIFEKTIYSRLYSYLVKFN